MYLEYMVLCVGEDRRYLPNGEERRSENLEYFFKSENRRITL